MASTITVLKYNSIWTMVVLPLPSSTALRLKPLLGFDNLERPRSLFLYDGAWGVWKFTVSVVARMDLHNNMRFSPLQTPLSSTILKDLDLDLDLSTAYLIEGEKQRVYSKSSSILRMLFRMGFPFPLLAFLLLLIPVFVRDFGYEMFARHRGAIWKTVKKLTGMGDVSLLKYRDKVILPDNDDDIPVGWGFQPKRDKED